MNMIKISDSCKNHFQSFYKLPVIGQVHNWHLSSKATSILGEKKKKKETINL